MPFYEYQCQQCGHHFDARQSINDAPLKTCPKCQADELKKLVSQTSFHLKGSGWYKTDYAAKTTKPKDDTKKSETKTDNKVKDETKSSKENKSSSGSTSGSKD